MQYRKDYLYKAINQIYPELSVEYIEALLNFTMNKIEEWTRNPKSLILKVRRLGSFYYRKTAIQRDLDINNRKKNEGLYLPENMNEEWFKRAEFILKECERYTQKKLEIRKLRYGKDYKDPEQLKIEKRKILGYAD